MTNGYSLEVNIYPPMKTAVTIDDTTSDSSNAIFLDSGFDDDIDSTDSGAFIIN